MEVQQMEAVPECSGCDRECDDCKWCGSVVGPGDVEMQRILVTQQCLWNITLEEC